MTELRNVINLLLLPSPQIQIVIWTLGFKKTPRPTSCSFVRVTEYIHTYTKQTRKSSELLVFGLCPSSDILKTRKYNVSESGPITVLRRRRDAYSVTSLNHWTTHVELSLVTTDNQSASVSWNKAPIWGLRPDFYCCQTVAGLLMWSDLSDERTGLPFTITTGPQQRSHSRVRVPWDPRPYFTVSDSSLSSLSPPTSRRATVEIFDPAPTRDINPCQNYYSYLMPETRL
jgi:hypothetical protein